MSVIRLGSRGPAVSKLQNALNAHGFICKIDGEFGASTEQQVLAFQRKYGLKADGVVGNKTWSLLNSSDPSKVVPPTLPHPSIESVLTRASALGHKVWDTPWKLWLFGIRSPNRSANSFDDLLGATWIDGSGARQSRFWIGTTDPGTYWLLNPSNRLGCAILVEGQYLDVWKIDKHAGKYDALCQRNGKVKVYRDPSLDNKHDLDPKTIQAGEYGINIHAATQRPDGISVAVDKWSAGCQVHATDAGFDEMMALALLQRSNSGLSTFSYTLLNHWV